MAARRGKNGRFTKSRRNTRRRTMSSAPRRRRTQKAAVKILPLAETVVGANILSEGLFGTNAYEFVTAGTFLNPNSPIRADGTSRLTLQEMINWKGDSGNVGSSHAAEYGTGIGGVLMSNLKKNWFEIMIKTTIAGFGFKVLPKLMRKPIANANKLLKMGTG